MAPLDDTAQPLRLRYSNLHPHDAPGPSRLIVSDKSHHIPLFEQATSMLSHSPPTNLPASPSLNAKSTHVFVYEAANPIFSSHLETIPAMKIDTVATATCITTENSLSNSVIASIARFRRLQNQNVPEPDTYHGKAEEQTLDPPQLGKHKISTCQLPSDMMCDVGMRLPERWQRPASIHRYMASLGLIQKRTLTSALSSEEIGRIQLIERAKLQGADEPDLIIDPHRAALFVPISHLPTINRELMTRLTSLLESYSKILLIFEAYPSSHSYGSSSRKRAICHITRKDTVKPLEVDSLSPPVLAALKRFRRELTIERELASHDKAGLSIHVVCAPSIEEAAMYARLWGDQAEVNCERELASALWDERNWLQQDENEALLPAFLLGHG